MRAINKRCYGTSGSLIGALPDEQRVKQGCGGCDSEDFLAARQRSRDSQAIQVLTEQVEDSGLATRNKSGRLLAVGLGVAAVAYFGIGEVIEWGEGVIDDWTSEDYAVAAGGKPLVKQCTTEQVVKQRRCGDTKILVLDAAKMPYITRNISAAWSEGKPFVLTRNSALQNANRGKACKGFPYKYAANKGSCDEYPFATTDEGGAGARVAEVHASEQNCQGGTISRGYQISSIANGDKFLVVISNPGKIATKEWDGKEAKAGAC